MVPTDQGNQGIQVKIWKYFSVRELFCLTSPSEDNLYPPKNTKGLKFVEKNDWVVRKLLSKCCLVERTKDEGHCASCKLLSAFCAGFGSHCYAEDYFGSDGYWGFGISYPAKRKDHRKTYQTNWYKRANKSSLLEIAALSWCHVCAPSVVVDLPHYSPLAGHVTEQPWCWPIENSLDLASKSRSKNIGFCSVEKQEKDSVFFDKIALWVGTLGQRTQKKIECSFGIFILKIANVVKSFQGLANATSDLPLICQTHQDFLLPASGRRGHRW